MKNIFKLLTLSSVILLSGCMGEHASFTESMKDNFFFTSASDVPSSQAKCVRLSKPYTMQSGSATFSLPEGHYIARKKRDTGYFYYAPSLITSSNSFLYGSPKGIYLNNAGNQGNLFDRNPQGDNRPVRGAVLPSDIFSYLKKC
jgi:hypothetical protein